MRLRYVKVATMLGAVCLLIGTVGGCPLSSLFPQAPEPNCPEPNTAEPNTPEPNTPEPNTPEPNATTKTVHEKIFTEILSSPDFEGTSTCLNCHSNHARNILETQHWNWSAEIQNIPAAEGETHGKVDIINAFCISIPSNEGRCSQCHPSYGWRDDTFDFTDIANIDCLICHDGTGTYRKHPTDGGGGGAPALLVDGEVVPVTDMSELNPVAYSVSPPKRQNCGLCHFYAGGGDNVKHGDLSSALAEATEDLDVHMGGQDFSCQTCHTETDHQILGTTEYSGAEGIVSCQSCHTDRPHSGMLGSLLNLHLERVACQTCHIPTFARGVATKLEWYWDEAGQDGVTPDEQYGRETYDKKKGRFVWGMDVKPVFRWHNGKWFKRVIGVNDTYTEAGTVDDPILICGPVATADDADAKIYPFKEFKGTQPVDPVNKRLVVPHLFGTAAGPSPYWAEFNWDAAISEGTAYAGQDYSGTYDFAHTVSYLSLNHEIAPATEARQCEDCHGVDSFWEQLGISDPFGS